MHARVPDKSSKADFACSAYGMLTIRHPSYGPADPKDSCQKHNSPSTIDRFAAGSDCQNREPPRTFLLHFFPSQDRPGRVYANLSIPGWLLARVLEKLGCSRVREALRYNEGCSTSQDTSELPTAGRLWSVNGRQMAGRPHGIAIWLTRQEQVLGKSLELFHPS